MWELKWARWVVVIAVGMSKDVDFAPVWVDEALTQSWGGKRPLLRKIRLKIVEAIILNSL